MAEREVCENPEEQPVVVGRWQSVDPPQPVRGLTARLGRERLPERLGRQQEGERQPRHLDHALVVQTHIAPVFRMSGVGAVGQACRPVPSTVMYLAARDQRRETPQRPREALHFGRRASIMRAPDPQTDPGPTLGL
jgi:hypothetical protein